MLNLAEKEDLMPKTTYFGPARVLEINETEGLVHLRLEGREKYLTWGRSAMPYFHEFKWGETVLVAGEDIHNLYVIGLLNTKAPGGTDEKRLSVKNGTTATVERTPEGERLQVCSKSGELIFEYDSQTGNSRVNIHSGDLEFITRNGNIHFASDQDIRFTSKQSVEIKSQQGIRIMTTDVIGKILASLSLNRKTKLSSQDLGITAQRGDIQIEESNYSGKKFISRIVQAKLTIGSLQMQANNVIEKAENVYRTVKGLMQLKTQRMRTLVEATYHLKTRKSFLKSKEDFKVNADKIHLG